MTEDPFKRVPHGARQPAAAGGFVVDKSIGISQAKLEEIVTKFRTLAHVEADMRVKGPAEYSKPTFQPSEVTPETLATENPAEYTRIFAEQLAWLNYFSPMMGKVEAACTENENILKLVDAQIRKDMIAMNKTLTKGEKFSEPEIDAEVLTNPTYQDCLLEVQKMRQYRYQVDAWINISNRNIRVVSRQVSLRGQEIEGSNREANVTKAGGGGRRYGPIRG
jgi:hypothetical protein